MPAWLAWLFLHIFLLIGFRNRAVVLIEWAVAYFTFQRGARLITGDPKSLSLSLRSVPYAPRAARSVAIAGRSPGPDPTRRNLTVPVGSTRTSPPS